MADSGSATVQRVRDSRPPPQAPSQPAGANVADRWVAQLRRKAREDDSGQAQTPRRGGQQGGGGQAAREQQQQQQQAPPQGIQGRYRPASSSTTGTGRPTSSSPSLFSLESGPASPTTTAPPPFPFPSSQPPPHRHSAAPASSSHQHSYPPRSHASLPPTSSPPLGSAQAERAGGGRHREQLDRVYGDSRYDAEFDRSVPRTSSSSTATQQPTASSSRALFIPDAPNNSHHHHLYSPHAPSNPNPNSNNSASNNSSSNPPRSSRRSKRDVVEPADVGARRGGKDSRESLESEEFNDTGRPASRSSRESKTRRKKEDGSSRRRDEDPGASSTSLGGAARLYDHKKDDPIKFPTSGRSSKKSTINDNRSLASSAASFASSDPGAEPRHGAKRRDADPPPFVMELKRAYREITDAESKIQDEHRAALAAAAREDDAQQGVRIQSGVKKLDDEYWVKLATSHKQLADAHYSFLQMALDPRHPASLHSLPAKYNIPTRLWQTGFHQLLERMRHAISSAPSPSSSEPTNVLEHLIEFIQYAYGFYSQLFEDSTIALFRPAWIEQLGDLARYRMAVAGLASRVSAASASSNGYRGIRDGELDERQPRPVDAASIGDAALGDWEVEEQESWRVIARDWYGQGVTETPGTGRLQHHLALLSKGDEMRGLYHYAKSLTAAHPYVSARESILPLFEDEHQARRTQPDVTKAELFVHLHGMLFTKIALDDFSESLARFLERLGEDGVRMGSVSGNWSSLGETGANAPFGDAEWFMLGVINIAALLQYGADDGVLRKYTPQASKDATPAPATTPTHQSAQGKTRTPQAIMLNPSSLKRADTPDDDLPEAATSDVPSTTTDVVMQLGPAPSSDDSDDPLVFLYAQQLTFAMLELALQHPFRIVNDAKVANPYIVLILTFLASTAQTPAALRHLERAVPWASIVAFFNALPSDVEVRLDAQTKLVGSPLPEDWCIRGMDWTGKHVFGRGYWKSKSPANGKRDEMAPPPISGPPSAALVESEQEALRFSLDNLDEFADEDSPTPSATLASARWKRVATLAAWLVRAVPGLDFEASEKSGARFSISGGLDTKLRRWKKEEDDEKEAERRSRLDKWEADARRVEELDESTEDEDDDDDEDPADSDAVRELKARRRELKAIVREARQATRPQSKSGAVGAPRQKKANRNRPTVSTFPGFTVLVFDTNILLTSLRLFCDVVETETWTVVVPLAVITELDGLKKNASALGSAAAAAITYLEASIRQRSRHLKVQTSRGNYLKDLSIRSEAIDFAGSDAFAHDFARSMDDVILRAVAWQQDHFVSRLALVNPQADRRRVPDEASHVVLVTFDRNLRLKARARGLDATDEKGLGQILEEGRRNG
ncbi:hypothetical protein RQP46_005711 [Phenoliferia psychrophenolica]